MVADYVLAEMREALYSWNETDVNACLERMLASSIFARAERQKRLLRYLVDAKLAGKTEQLKGYTIGVEVFDRDPTFDPAIDAIVRVQAGQLRAKLREYYEGEGCDDPFRFELPKGGYAIRIEQGEPGATAREIPLAPPFSKGGDAQRRGDFIRMPPIDDKPSLAVLPFVNWSSDPEQEYFADGITEDLTTELSRLSGLFVISRHSAFVYKGIARRAEEIGAELGVRHLLEGSVRQCGGQVRISAQLIDATSGAHVWAERYDRDLKDIFAVQDDVTQRIVDVLQVKLSRSEKEGLRGVGIANSEAHDYLLRGLERFWVFTPESTNRAQLQFAQAVELEPSYAAGHAWLARALAFRWIMMWDCAPETLERAYKHAQVAIELDDRLPLAHAVLCWVQLWRGQGEASVAAGERAIALDPNNADAHLFLAFALSASARGAEALHYIEKGLRLNPHPSAVYLSALGHAYVVLERYDEAVATFKRGVDVTDVFIPNHYWLCILYTLLGREDEARGERDVVLALTGGRKPILESIWLDEDLRVRLHGLAETAGLAYSPAAT